MAERTKHLQPTSTSAEALEREVAAIAAMNVEELRARWRKVHGAPPPAPLSKDLIARALAYQVQGAALGGLSAEALRTLRSLASSGSEPQRKVKIGSVLVREFAGVLHEVVVVPSGFLWQGRAFDSLSIVAKEITGTNWNGPRFFGLREKRRPPAVSEAPVAGVDSPATAPSLSRSGRRSSIGSRVRAGQGSRAEVGL